MNRVVFTIIEKGTTVPCKQLNSLHDPQPHQIAYQSESFPVYPITISMYLQNPPFNKFSICFEDNFSPCKATLLGSQDGNQFVKFHDLTDILQRQDQYTIIFKEKLFFSYVRLVLFEPPKSKVNVCNQLKLRGLQFTLISFMQTRYACSLKMRLSYHPVLFRLLELLEYKMLLLKQNKNRLYQKYQKRLQEVINMIALKSFNKLFPDQNVLKKFNQQIAYIQAEPISQQAFIKYPDPVQVKKDLYKLQKELKAFQVDRFSSISPHIAQYFQKYVNTQIKEGYLRQLSSNEPQDHNKALTNFWAEVKNLQSFTKQTEEAIIMFLNFFLQFIEAPLKTTALKTLILFSKKNANPFIQQLNKTYDRVLFNIFKYLHQTQDSQLRELSLRYCYMLYSRVTNKTFLQQLLNAYKDYTLEEQLQKMQILQKLTFRGVDVYNKDEIVHFLIDLLLSNKLNVTEKNRAYNIAAYLASKYGKADIMKDFQKLNSMLLMTMQKNIDNKLSKMNHVQKKAENQQSPSCQYCGTFSNSFKDQNLYDLHLARECKFLTNCKYCHQNIEIPQLFKHYIEQCDQKLSFKHCDNCFEVIEIKEEEKHNQKCAHKLQTRCPLCYQKVDNKLRLKEHVLVSGCPNNPR